MPYNLATPPLDEDWIWRRVRPAADEIAADLRSRGLHCTAASETARENFISAARYLASIPTLQAVLASLVRTVTLLDAEPGYDVSHSEPRWPGSIFVSSPPAGMPSAALRLLENIVHEGMHLQLTLLEDRLPLVLDKARRLFSPWKEEERDVQGVLHGVYVFACIAALFAEPVLLGELNADGQAYAARRRSEIALELADIDTRLLNEGLSEEGRRFFVRLLSPTGQPPWMLPHTQASATA